MDKTANSDSICWVLLDNYTHPGSHVSGPVFLDSVIEPIGNTRTNGLIQLIEIFSNMSGGLNFEIGFECFEYWDGET